jgi:hypothetical protein
MDNGLGRLIEKAYQSILQGHHLFVGQGFSLANEVRISGNKWKIPLDPPFVKGDMEDLK